MSVSDAAASMRFWVGMLGGRGALWGGKPGLTHSFLFLIPSFLYTLIQAFVSARVRQVDSLVAPCARS